MSRIALAVAFVLPLAAACGQTESGDDMAYADPNAQVNLDDPATGLACADPGAMQSCGGGSFMYCDDMSDSDDLQWGPCIAAADMECTPGIVEYCDEGQSNCELVGGVPMLDDSDCWDIPDGSGGTTGTPLLLRFDDLPVAYSPMSSVGFDIDTIGQCESYDWPLATTPWLALDRDGNGAIEDGSELFGSGTRLESGRRASNGFEALRELDSNADGVISDQDQRWGELSTWGDTDGDRVGSGLELNPVAQAGLVRIELDYHVDKLCDARGNCEVEKASFVWRDAKGLEHTGEVVDVHLACQ